MKYILLLFTFCLGTFFNLQQGYGQELRNCDLEIQFQSPADSFQVFFGETIEISFQIINHGPDIINLSDTLLVYWGPFASVLNQAEILVGDTLFSESIGQLQHDGGEEDVLSTQCVYLDFNTADLIDTDTTNNSACVSGVFVGTGSAIEEMKLAAKQLILIPNPAQANVQLLNLPPKSNLVIRSTTGQVVWKGMRPADGRLDISFLSSGLYFIQGELPGKDLEKYWGKLIIQ